MVPLGYVPGLKNRGIFKILLLSSLWIRGGTTGRTGEDWGGHVIPNIFQDRFVDSSKSEEKYLGGGGTMVAHEKNSSTDKQGNEKDFCQ